MHVFVMLDILLLPFAPTCMQNTRSNADKEVKIECECFKGIILSTSVSFQMLLSEMGSGVILIAEIIPTWKCSSCFA